MFVFGYFSIHHKDWLTYFCRTDRPSELGYNFSLSNDVTQMVKFPTQTSDCGSLSLALLDLLFLLTLVFVLQWLSLHWENLIMFLAQSLLTFYQIHNGRLRLIISVWSLQSSWSFESCSMGGYLLVNFVSGFRLELMYISLIVSIRSSVTHISIVFSCLCCCHRL